MAFDDRDRDRDRGERKQKSKLNASRFKKSCVFCKKNLAVEIDYKNIDLLSRYVSSKGKITSRRISGNCAKHQRAVAREIKKARFLSLLPYLPR
ncbi:MAG: 30S ribosomal protein S18 [Candidatus Omnitrophica bacterium]|nr:30S ribosomal protein S18 [Candidatus Omnitrophota bacterium]